MSNFCIILGNTGSGKSSSIRNLDPKETIIISVVNKVLPFKGSNKIYNAENKNRTNIQNSQEIVDFLDGINKNLPHIKNVIIDDCSYIMRYEFFDRIKDKGYEKYNEIGNNFRRVIQKCTNLRDDINVFMMMHCEPKESEGSIVGYKPSTIGKLIDEKFNPLELVSTVLYCCPRYKDNGTPEFGFYTKRMKLDGIEIPAKSPDGMFDEEFIPNDLNIVINKMNEFYN